MAKQERILIAIDLDRSQAEKQILANAQSLRGLKAEASQLNKELKAGKLTEEEFTRALLENQKAQKALTAENKQLENSIKATNNTVEGLRARIAALTAESNKMDLNSDEFKSAQIELKALNDQLIQIGKDRANFKDNVGNYASSIEGLEERLKSLTVSAKGMDLGSQQFKAAQKEIQSVRAKLDEANKALNKTKENTISVSDAVDKMVPGLGSAATGLGGMTKQALRFIATPLGAVLGAIGLAVSAVTRYFQSSEEGQNKFAKVTRTVSILLGNLSDILSDVGKRIVEAFENPQKALQDFGNMIKTFVMDRVNGALEGFGLLGKAISHVFAGEFSEAMDAASEGAEKLIMNATPIGLIIDGATAAVDGFNKVWKETMAEVSEGFSIEDLKAQTDVLERQLVVQRAVNEAKIAELKLRAEDKSLDVKERAAALQEAARLQDELSDLEITVARNRLEIKKRESEFSKSTKEDLMEEAELEAELYRIQKNNADKKKELFTKDQALQGELRKIALADSIAILEKQLVEAEKYSTEEFELQRKLIQQKRDAALQAQQLTEAQRQLIIAQAYAAEQELLVAHLEKQRDLQLQSVDETERRKLALARQAMLQGRADREAFEEEEFQIRQEALQAEIAALEEGSLARIEKEVELEQLRVDRLNAIRDAEFEKKESRLAAETELDRMRIDSAKGLADGLAAAADENTVAGQTALALQKGLALAEVAMNLQQEIAANNLAAAKIAAQAPPATIAAGATYSGTRNAFAVVRAAAAAAKIGAQAIKFSEGGVDNIATEGGFMHRLGGMITGRAHGEGGVRFPMRSGRIGEADGRKGEAYIINTRNDPKLKALASAINVAGGGRPFYGAGIEAIRNMQFAYGGIARFDDGGIALAGSAPQMSLNDVVDIVRNMPSPRVLVDDIDTGLSTKVMIEDGSTI